MVVDSNSVSYEHSVDANIGAEHVQVLNTAPASNDGQVEVPKKRKLSSSPPVARKMSNVGPIFAAEMQLAACDSQLEQNGNACNLAASETSKTKGTKTTDSKLRKNCSKVTNSVSKRTKQISGAKKPSSKPKILDHKAKHQTTKSTKNKQRKSSSSSSSSGSSSDSSSGSSSSSSSSESSSSSSDSNKTIKLPTGKSSEKETQVTDV